MSNTVAVNDANFSEVLTSNNAVLVDFWATWCGPCKMMAPILEEFAGEHKGKVVVAKLDVDQNPRMAEKYSVMSIPTLILFQQGKVVKQLIGLRPKAELESQLASVL